jgi:solute carrier family 25 (mitochondrial iron transporter), member 28/37
MYNSPYKSAFDCIQRTLRKEGVKAFYRSYFTQLNMNIPFQCTHLVTYDYVQSHLNPDREYNPLSHSISGALSGAVAAAITTPLDVCKTLINTQECCNPEELCKKTINVNLNQNASRSAFNMNAAIIAAITAFVRSQSTTTSLRATGLRDAVHIIYSVDGYRGFFKGLVPRVLFQMPGTAISWSVYEYFKYYLKIRNQSL